ncbi:universal stress protein [Streptomyces hygroscopicus]|uniref:universal stress protein n=1 Tax=Streptomyces hygroscopicus TaxID=1912 RepID=UPI0004C65AC4|nr:universal stress protein [Streptomyces hygroscopicus]
MPASITVGVDGFPESPRAAHWAAREALLRDLRLRLVHAWPPLSPAARTLPHEDAPDHWAQRLLTDLVGELHDAYPGLRVTAELVPQAPVPALLAAARDAEMLVLGSRGRGTPGGFLLGSTGRHVLAHGERPVIMVHADDSPLTADVAVGVSLPEPDEEPLRFAFDAAARRGGALRAVHAGASGPRGEEADALGEALRPWREKYPGVPVAEALSAERAPLGVVHAVPGSGLLVLGRAETEPGPVPQLGSVVHAAVHHAPCPVAVVPCG